MEKDFEYYMSLPYTITIIPDRISGGFVAKVNELPGCITQADTIEETLAMIEDAKRAWIDVALQNGMDIPEPDQVEDDTPGKFLLRLPKSLQRELANRAKAEGVSLNQYMLYQLARAVGPIPPIDKKTHDEMAAGAR